jgi:hypothetical protein
MLIIFTLSLFTSATLLFLVQPMFAKMVLPKLGGTPAVWITCMVFYQAALLGGYVYAHLITSRLGVKRQLVLHLVLLLSAFLFLPIGMASAGTPPVEANPIPWLFMLLLLSVGLPFLVISTTAPLLQKWFALTLHPAARDPYFLYVASNLGSMMALLGYPILVEPHLTLAQQSWAWSLGYGLLATLIVVCGVILWRSPGRQPLDNFPPAPSSAVIPEAPANISGTVNWRRRFWWILLALAPSSLLLGVTEFITTDIAAVPLLWVVPLALYLFTFCLAFAPRPLVRLDSMVRAQPFFILALAILFLWKMQSAGPWVILLHLLTFFVTAMVCHGELAQSRPPTAYLTEFYLWIAVGGVLGGLFNALVAPLVFKVVVEYPLAIVLACLLRPGRNDDQRHSHSRRLDFGLPLALGLVLFAVVKGFYIHHSTAALLVTISCLTAMLCYSFANRPLRFGLGVAVIMIGGTLVGSSGFGLIHGERSFYGVLQVMSDPDRDYHLLYHGSTLHGAQSIDPARQREPLTYFCPRGPVGQVFEAFHEAGTPREVAILGLGTGSLACYAAIGQHWTFYEIDPAVERIARDTRYFTYLRDCPAKLEVILGDARLSLTKAPDRQYGLIVFDAFSSDAVPIHLIDREAIKLYLDKLANGGLMVFNISNRYLDLQPVLANLAQDQGLVALVQEHFVTEADKDAYYVNSMWVVMARRPGDLGRLAKNGAWQPVHGKPGARLWTDDFSDVFSALKWPFVSLSEIARGFIR